MKKMKVGLLTAVAALGLSGCTFKEGLDIVGDSAKKHWTHGVALLEKGWNGITGKDTKKKNDACKNHEDKNHDGVCDVCGQVGLEVVHVDANKDHACDVCGIVMSDCADEDADFLCDICGRELEVASVVLDTDDAVLAFAQGAEFSAEGVKVIATSELGSTMELEFTTSEPDMATLGEQVVTVTYEVGGEEATLEYTIEVSYWSELDLEVFSVVSLTGYAPLPFMPGVGMEVEIELDDEGYLTDWAIVTEEGIDADTYLAYYEMLSDYNEKVTLSGKETYYQLAEIEADVEGYADLTDCAAFRLVPYYFDDKGYESRLFINDEYFVLGIDAYGRLTVKSRTINAMLDGYFLGNEVADGTYGFPAPYGPYVEYVADLPYYYYTEFAYDAFVMPEVSDLTSFTPISYFALYPFNERLDAYDLAMQIDVGGATAEEHAAFVAALVAAGYALAEEGDGYDVYFANIPYVGEVEYTVYDFEANGGWLVFDLFYVAPGPDYITFWQPYAEELIAAGGAYLLGAEIDDTYYDYGYLIIENYFEADGEFDAEAVANAIAAAAVAAGWEARSAAEYKSSYGGYYEAVVSNNVVDVEIDVYVTPEEDGTYYISFWLSEAVPTSTELTPLVEAAVALLNGENADYDYSYWESAGEIITFFDSPMNCEEIVAALVAAGFEVTEEPEYSASYGQYGFNVVGNGLDIEIWVDGEATEGLYGVEFYAVAAEEEVDYAEQAMVAVLAEWYEVDPSEITLNSAYGYNVDKEYYYTSVSMGTDYPVESYGEMACVFLAMGLPEGFVKDTENCEVIMDGDNVTGYFATYVDETNGVVATFESYWYNEAYGLCVDITTYLTGGEDPVVVTMTPESLIQDLCTGVWGTAVLNDDYYSDGQGGFYTTIGMQANDESKNQYYAEMIQSYFVPENFSVYQAGETTLSSGIAAYEIVLVDFDLGLVYQITAYVHPTAACNVIQVWIYSM